jgi:branched-chain amino acid transport system permease protein
MTSTVFAQLLMNGFAIGMIYVLVASGLILVLGVVRIFNFAHGEFYMLGAFITFACIEYLGLGYALSVLIAIVLVTLFSLVCYRYIFHYIRGDILLCTAASIGLSMMVLRGSLLGFGTQERGLPSPFGTKAVGIGEVTLPPEKLAAIFLCLLVMLGLYLLLMKTKVGKAMRAVKMDNEVAALQGINTTRIYLFAFATGSALAAFAGGIIAPVFAITPNMGHALLLNCFMALIVGGFSSMLGGVIGGLVIGFVLSFGTYYLGGLSEILLFVVIAVVLIFKPGGLFGEPAEH